MCLPWSIYLLKSTSLLKLINLPEIKMHWYSIRFSHWLTIQKKLWPTPSGAITALLTLIKMTRVRWLGSDSRQSHLQSLSHGRWAKLRIKAWSKSWPSNFAYRYVTNNPCVKALMRKPIKSSKSKTLTYKTVIQKHWFKSQARRPWNEKLCAITFIPIIS